MKAVVAMKVVTNNMSPFPEGEGALSLPSALKITPHKKLQHDEDNFMNKAQPMKRRVINTTEIKNLITSLSLTATLGFWSWFSNPARNAAATQTIAPMPAQSPAGVMLNPPPQGAPALGSGQLPPLRQVNMSNQMGPTNNLPLAQNLPQVQPGNNINRDITGTRPNPIANTRSSR